MLGAVRTALDSILGSATFLQAAAGSGRLFELFLVTGIAFRLQQRGLDVWLQRSDGTRIAPTDLDRRYIQRGGAPSGLAPATAGAGNASVIAFMTSAGRGWEIWNGVQFRGRSWALHEIDIAVVPAEIGDELRLTGGVPFGRPRVAVECKDVGLAGSVDEMRAFVARLYDLTILEVHCPFYPLPPPPFQSIYPGNLGGHPFHGAPKTYLHENGRTMNVVARRTGFRSGSVAMTSYYRVEPRGFITASSAQADLLLNRVADWVVATCL